MSHEPGTDTRVAPLLAGFSSRRHLPQLDSLRGIAVLAVLAVHSPAAAVLPHGWLGVDLFFVLSGFLITGILLDSRDRPRYFGNFYARRALRIWPLYFLVLTLAFGIGPALFPGRFAHEGWTLPWFVTYLQNYRGIDRGPAVLDVTWSLAIEEQFYFVWPFLVFLVSRRTLAAVALGVMLASPVLRYLLLSHAVPADLVYRWTFTRPDGLAAGALLAIVLRSRLAVVRSFSWVCAFVLLSFSGVLAVCLRLGYASVTVPRNHALYALSFTASALAFAGAAGLSLSSARVIRALDWQALRHAGKISYGLYVYHMFVFMVMRAAFGEWLAQHPELDRRLWLGGFWVFAIIAVFAIAEVSWVYVESPILRLKARFENARSGSADTAVVGRSAA